MSLTSVSTESAPAAIGPYSQAIWAGPFLYLSGQLGIDPKSGELAGPDLRAQAPQAMENLVNILAAAGLATTDVVSVDVYMTNMGQFSEFNEIYSSYFDTHKPARAAIGVASLPLGASVEVRCVACRTEAA
ncbi:MAG: Rid family detoxifying hydrolase [Desulfosarcinaceae bacterium]|nr:Rid family detoxifying hydrolase [Desulfosarcinaceae bacterium]